MRAMRNFTCFTVEEAGSSSKTIFIVAEDEWRARELARRELRDLSEPLSFEIREGGKLRCVGLAA